jgi:glutamyl-tRNA(Gln) amidotransferase subunit D
MTNLSKDDIGYLALISKEIDGKKIEHKGYVVDVSIDVIKLKLLDNGYNIDVKIDKNTKIEKLSDKINLGSIPIIKLKENKDLPSITYIGTGGTIGTHVDYNTGAVFMCRTPEEIIATVPELSSIINIKEIKSPFIKPSEDFYAGDWKVLSSEIFNSITNKDIDGIIITHGTDTLSYTGTAISFMIENINKPILLVGAQRSPDRASFDGRMNLICASYFINEKIPGVYLVMHGSINDDFCYVIRATKSRKMHTSRRDAFRAINDTPIAKVYVTGKIEFIVDKLKLQQMLDSKKPILRNSFEDKVAIIKIYPNSDPSIIDWYIEKGYKGLVLEGTGLGHVPTGVGGTTQNLPPEKAWLPFIEKAIKKGIIIIITSQCLFGRVNSKVYANLRYLAEVGAEYLDSHDMLPETAYIKLGVGLSLFKTKEEVINYMKTNISGEITEKESPEFFDMEMD